MRKLGLLIMPIMAVSFLVGCNGESTYKFDFEGTNCSADNKKSYKKGAEVNFTITADSSFALPNEISVDGTTTYDYGNTDNITATFSCTMPASNVKVTVEALKGHTFTFNGVNCTANNKEIYGEGSAISFEIAPDPYFMLPPSISTAAVEGVEEYEYTKDGTSGIATFSCTMTADVTIRVWATQDPVKTLLVTKEDGSPIPPSIDALQSFNITAKKLGGDLVDATFTSSDEAVLSITKVETGKVTVTGESGGSAVITCKADGYAPFTRKIEVIPLVMQIKKEGGTEDLPTSIYKEDEIEIAAYGKNGKVEGAKFSTEDKTITITEKNNKVILTGVSEGNATIVCKAKGYRDAEAYIHVNDLQTMTIKLATGDDIPSVIDIDIPTEIVAYDGNIPLTSGVTFTSSDSNIIEVNSNGTTIKGKKAGTATITAKAVGYKDATCTIEVRKIYAVTCTSTDVTLSNLVASTDKDYVTTITVKTEKINQGNGYSVPDTLSIQTGTAFLDPDDGDYTYTPTENTFSAELVIPKENIAGTITIGLSVKELTPLCFTSKIDNNKIFCRIRGSMDLSTIDIEYCTDLTSQNWQDWPIDDGELYQVTRNKDEKIYIRNTKDVLTPGDGSAYFYFDADNIDISGNVNSMINYSALKPYCFTRLFEVVRSNVTGAPALPATTLAEGCYESMFDFCNFLTAAPALPATTLAKRCYYGMFSNCSNLIDAPELPATTLQDNCYQLMFYNCSKLAEYIELPATTLVKSCYYMMFKDCSKINHIKVGFGTSESTAWPPEEDVTLEWLEGVAEKGTFVWKGSADGPTTRDVNTVPSGWTCESYQ